MLTEGYLETTKPCGLNHLITVQGKYFCLQRNLNLKLLILNCLCHKTAIHYTLVVLSSNDL